MKNNQKGALWFLYHTALGRIILKPLVSRPVSKLCGAFLSSRLSKPLIKGFVKGNSINLADYKATNFKCFNDCFCREIKPELRPIDMEKSHLISPCDGLLSAYKITADTVLPIKQSSYTIKALLGDDEIHKSYENGICLVFRLSVNHYHRYCFLDNLKIIKNRFLKGRLHTVRPVALERYPVFIQNCREYTVMETENFGIVTQIEVGAMLVGKIQNHHTSGEFLKGEEKGMFLYGGSTIVVLLEKNAAELDPRYFENTEKGIETAVKMGEALNI